METSNCKVPSFFFRSNFFASGVNKDSLKAIEDAAFVVVFSSKDFIFKENEVGSGELNYTVIWPLDRFMWPFEGSDFGVLVVFRERTYSFLLTSGNNLI